ncbi:Gfo/Idh/MocA family oxidoreductase [Escherichia coli]
MIRCWPIWEIKSEKLRIGVVGLGGIAQKRGYRCWRQRLTGRYKGHGRLRARKPCQFVKSWRIPYADSLSSLAASCDAVFVHSSTASHFDVVSTLLNAGVHVCVDKPLAEKSARC